MKIGIDITVLQTPHRLRGIGSVLINFINHMPEDIKKEHEFVFYKYDESLTDINPLETLDTSNIKYEVKNLHNPKKLLIHRAVSPLSPAPGKRVPRIVTMTASMLKQLSVLRDLILGDTRIDSYDGIDYFLQFDQNHPLPAKRKVKSALVLYDMIPYVMEADYLWSYSTARRNGKTRKRSVLMQIERWKYKYKLKLVVNKASNLFAISKHTKKDFVDNLGISEEKISVAYLGVADINIQAQTSHLTEYLDTSWGPMPYPLNLEGSSFVLFVGGADPRRRLVDLISAFNNIKAQGHDLHLVFAGDTMFGPFEIPNDEIKEYLKQTSYLKDIHFMGFVSEEQKNWLYKNAIAFVYPSVYEGFGLPVLEAMVHGTPVITYKNSSINEISGNSVLYANGRKDILDIIKDLNSNSKKRQKVTENGMVHARNYSWEKTVGKFFSEITSS